MMQSNDDQINSLNLIQRKLKIHQALHNDGFLLEGNAENHNLELLIQIVSSRMTRALTLTNMDLIKLLGEEQMNEQALATSIMEQSNLIAVLKHQIMAQWKQRLQITTPKRPTNQFGLIKSPKVLQSTDRLNRSAGHVSASHVLASNANLINQTKRHTSLGTQPKKKKKYKQQSDVKGMNLTRILEVKENINDDSNLLLFDQTFADPLPQDKQVYITLSPNQIINNREPKPKEDIKPTVTQSIEFSLQILERLEQLESQLKLKDQQNEDLQAKNKLLVQKVKEFSEQNKANVECAKQEITCLQRQVKELITVREQDWEAQQREKEHMDYLEEENRVLSQRLVDIEESSQQIKQYKAELNEDILEKGKIEISQNIKIFHLKRRWFYNFKRACFLSKILNMHLTRKKKEQSRHWKLLCYLYLRKEAAFARHIQQMQHNKNKQVASRCFTSLRLNVMHQKKTRQLTSKVAYRLKTFYFKCLSIHKDIAFQKRLQKLNAYKVRQLILTNKAFKCLKHHLHQNQLLMHPQALQLINQTLRLHRKRLFFSHFKRVIRSVLPRERALKHRAQLKFHRHLLGVCFNSVFKGLLRRKKGLKSKINRVLIPQRQKRLVVNGFSALLFYKVERQSRKPLKERVVVEQKRMFMRRWARQVKVKQNNETKLKFFRLRWSVLKKKVYLKGLRRAVLKSKIREKFYSLIKAKQRFRSTQQFFKEWTKICKESFLSKRLIKHQVMRSLKNNTKSARVINLKNSLLLKRNHLSLQSRTFSSLKSILTTRLLRRKMIQEFRQKHVETIKRKILLKMLSGAFALCMHRQRQEIARLHERIDPLQDTFDEKENQVNYFINKCCDLEQQNQDLEASLEKIHEQYEDAMRTQHEIHCQEVDDLQRRIGESEAERERLEIEIERIQLEQLKKLQEYKEKFMKSQQEIEMLRRNAAQEPLEHLSDKETLKRDEENNIKLLHQLKKAHKTIEEMRAAIDSLQSQLTKLKKERETQQRMNDQEREEILQRHKDDVQEIAAMVDKVKRENKDLKKEIQQLSQKISKEDRDGDPDPIKHKQAYYGVTGVKKVRFENDEDRYPTKH